MQNVDLSSIMHELSVIKKYMCSYYYTTFTITGGAGDVTVNLPFDWTNGTIFVAESRASTDYYMAVAGVVMIRFSTYDSITNAAYTANHTANINIGAASSSSTKTVNGLGTPKSATTLTCVFDDDGTTCYCKITIIAKGAFL